MGKSFISSHELLDTAFPFHVVVGRTMQLEGVGPTLRRLIPTAEMGEPFDRRFRITAPLVAPTFDKICAQARSLFVLESTDRPLRLRGQLLPSKGFGIFLCAPWIRTWEEMDGLGLSTHDFPVHDVVALVESLNALVDARQNVASSESKLATTTNALRASEERYRLLFESSPVGKCVFALDTLSILAVNDAVLQMYGYSRAEFLGMRIVDLKLPEDVPGLERELSTLKPTGLELVGLKRHVRKDGTIIEVDITAQRTEFGGRSAVLAMIRDVTHERGLEEQLRQSQKMEAIGRLAGGIAHDFNNMMAAVLGYAGLIALELSEGDPILADVRDISAAAQRAAGLTQQLLTFSRQQPYQPRSLSINTVIEHTQKMLVRTVGEDILIVSNLSPLVARIEADPIQLEQVLLNLVVNARDAMPKGGVLTIETDNVVLAEREAVFVGVVPGHYVLLTVGDDGAGMDHATRSRIFEPFFTTKEVGKGTGLGLATTHAIFQEHGGFMTCESVRGTGTVFSLYLPRQPAGSTHTARGASDARPPARGTETVLVIDDEPAIRRVVSLMLHGAGYVAREAASGGEALALLSDGDLASEVALVLLDVSMPGPPRREIRDRLRQLTRARVVYFSGYALDAADADPDDTVLEKPVTEERLLGTIRRVLDDDRITR